MRIIIIFLLAISLNGCITATVGTYRYATSGDKRTKQKFIEEFNRADFERQKNGLEPLDFCTEQYYFNQDWARSNPRCATRVVDYESGNTAALGKSELDNNLK